MSKYDLGIKKLYSAWCKSYEKYCGEKYVAIPSAFIEQRMISSHFGGLNEYIMYSYIGSAARNRESFSSLSKVIESNKMLEQDEAQMLVLSYYVKEFGKAKQKQLLRDYRMLQNIWMPNADEVKQKKQIAKQLEEWIDDLAGK